VTNPRVKVPLLLLAALLVHGLVLSQTRVAGVQPNLALLVAVAGSLSLGPGRGAVVGFVTGMLVDLLFLDTPLGLSALVFTLVAYAVGIVETGVLRSSWWLPLLVALAASAAGEALFALGGALIGQPHLVNDRLPLVIALVGALNTGLAVVVVPVTRFALREAPSEKTYA